MLFFVRCPTCGRCISTNLEKYFDKLNEIQSNPKTTKKEKEKLEAELLIEFGFDVWCHSTRIKGMLQYENIIV